MQIRTTFDFWVVDLVRTGHTIIGRKPHLREMEKAAAIRRMHHCRMLIMFAHGKYNLRAVATQLTV